MSQEPDSIAFNRKEGQLCIVVGSEIVASADNVANLIAEAHALGDSDPLKLRSGASLSLADLSEMGRDEVLAALRIDPALDDILSQLDSLDWEAPSVEMGISIDGAAWGWILVSDTDSHVSYLDKEEVHEMLIPVGPGEIVASASASFCGTGMTSGLFKEVGLRRWADHAALTWVYVPDNSFTSLSVDYEIDDWDGMLSSAFSGFFDASPICPWCDDSADWGVILDIDPMFSTAAIGEGLGEFWAPCEAHRDVTKGFILDVLDHDWVWAEDSWVALGGMTNWESIGVPPPW